MTALSIVVPCYNEEACLDTLHQRLSAAAGRAAGEDYEIVLVNDGSRDGSWEMMRQIAQKDAHVIAINLSRKLKAYVYEKGKAQVKTKYKPGDVFQIAVEAGTVKRELAYEAGEYLATELDARFSAPQMACFLASHLRTKRDEALRLGATPEQLEQMTSALYNGGEHNVRRMSAGLIGSLPETENYMRKVPTTKHRLDGVLARLNAPAVAQAQPLPPSARAAE